MPPARAGASPGPPSPSPPPPTATAAHRCPDRAKRAGQEASTASAAGAEPAKAAAAEVRVGAMPGPPAAQGRTAAATSAAVGVAGTHR